MARITMLGPEELDPDLRRLVDADAKTPLELGLIRIYGHRPPLAAAYVAFLSALRSPGLLPPRLIELVRLRIAFHNQCRSCMAVRYADGVADGVDEDLVCSLEVPEEAPDLTDAEKAALRFADLLATDHLAIDADVVADLKQHYSEPEVVELGMHVGVYVGFGRLSMAWDMVDELPDRFRARESGPITPWGSDATVVGRR